MTLMGGFRKKSDLLFLSLYIDVYILPKNSLKTFIQYSFISGTKKVSESKIK